MKAQQIYESMQKSAIECLLKRSVNLSAAQKIAEQKKFETVTNLAMATKDFLVDPIADIIKICDLIAQLKINGLVLNYGGYKINLNETKKNVTIAEGKKQIFNILNDIPNENKSNVAEGIFKIAEMKSDKYLRLKY